MKFCSMLMMVFFLLAGGSSARASMAMLSPRAAALLANPFTPAFGFNFAVTGQGGASPASTTHINARGVLKVRISALPPETVSFGTSVPYGCVQYKVSAGGTTVETRILAVPGVNNSLCPGAPQSQIVDLSAALGADETGVDVSISAASYDYFCQLVENGTLSLSYEAVSCPVRAVYRTHVISGTAEFQIR